jgi:hypothetical protein
VALAMAVSAAPVTPEVSFYVRRADPDDIDTISALFERKFSEDAALDAFARFYGIDSSVFKISSRRQKYLVSLIETCFMSVTVEDEDNNIVGFCALDDVPIQMANTEDAGTNWEGWFQQIYNDDSIDSMNSLWVSCCLVDLEKEVMTEILSTTFSTMPDLQNLLAFIPGTLHEEDARIMLQPFEDPVPFVDLQALGEAPAVDWAPYGSSVRVSRRLDVITPLFIRMARVEDHDNLVAVFNAQSEVITDVYGEYFIAELIEAQNDENKALVAEVDGRAVGLMCLTSDVDINVLSQCFQLDPYDNLLKPAVMRRIRHYVQAVFEGQSDVALCTTGHYMQVAFSSMDLDSLLESIPKMEDGRIGGVLLFQALQSQEFADDFGDALQDFEKGVMTLLWQANFLEPMLEVSSPIDPKHVGEVVQTFLSLDLVTRKDIANSFLERWSDVMEILKITKDALLGVDEAEEEKKDDDRGDEEVQIEIKAFLLALTQGVPESSVNAFPEDLVAKLIMVLHWWTDEEIGSPLATVPEDCFQHALEQIMASEEGLFVGHPNSPTWLSNMPQHAKDVFCVNMCCLDQAYQTQALDFLLPAFSLYPDKDYCIITQPHTAPNTPLLNALTIVPPQAQNTFSHVLYLIHRAALLGPPRVRPMVSTDVQDIVPLIECFDDKTREEIDTACTNYGDRVWGESQSITQEDGNLPPGHDLNVFVAEFDEQVVGLIVVRIPPPDVVDTLRCCYHLDDYLLVEHHEKQNNKGHGELVHWVTNPLFQKFSCRMLQGAMRLSGRSVLFTEMDLQKTVSPIFRDMLQVAPRRPPTLKKVKRKPPREVSFAKMPKQPPAEEDIREQERQQLLRDVAQTKALSVVAKKLLSETKIPVNSRIVVVGASDCGLSFLESLLSIPHLLFNSLTLLAPGGLEYHHSHHLPLIAGTAAYSHQELRRIMLELRVRILDSRMVQIDRQQRCCVLHDGAMLPYDYLIVGAGLQDDALHSLRIRSWGVTHVTDGFRKVNGAMSVADPSIRDLLIEGGTLIKSLIWNPLSYAVVYGRSLHAYCVVQGLVMRKVPPTKIILVLPPRLQDASHQLPVDAFYEGDEVEKKIHLILENMGMKVYDGYRLLGIQQDNRERLKALILEDHTSGSRTPVAPSEDGSQAAKGSHVESNPVGARLKEGIKARGVLEDYGVSPSGKPQKLLACRIVITADSHNVDPDIFISVHGNGLVYDGRLIVDHNFKTTDDAIFGAGSLCEFSRRFHRKNSQRYLRHDGFNGREVGAKLAHALLRVLDPVNGDLMAAGAPPRGKDGKLDGQPGEAGSVDQQNLFEGLDTQESSPDILPDFYMPIAKGGFLPGNLHYYRITSARKSDQADAPDVSEDRVIVTDTLDSTNGSGHFCRLTIDSFGKVDSISYLGGEELQVESLWSLVGLSETFLNHLYRRWRTDDIPDIVEFLTDEWATALFHDRFMDFCHQIKLEMSSQEEVKSIINAALEGVDTKKGGLSRELLASIRQKLPKESVKQMQDHLLEYLRENTNHLKTYFLPENWA